jgi:microcin C transport system ATP-binding protein
MAEENLLSLKNLSVTFQVPGGDVQAVKGVSLDIAEGETVALVGESGSGKSVTALSILQLLPYPVASHPSGSITFRGEELVAASPETLQRVRGDRISMIFQEPITSLNPLHTIQKQIGETLSLHKGLTGSAIRERVLELLSLVGIRDAEQRLTAYPHELSGGQRQRVMIAMALANELWTSPCKRRFWNCWLNCSANFPWRCCLFPMTWGWWKKLLIVYAS